MDMRGGPQVVLLNFVRVVNVFIVRMCGCQSKRFCLHPRVAVATVANQRAMQRGSQVLLLNFVRAVYLFIVGMRRCQSKPFCSHPRVVAVTVATHLLKIAALYR